MEDKNNILENLKNFLETDEGKESIKKFRERMHDMNHCTQSKDAYTGSKLFAWTMHACVLT